MENSRLSQRATNLEPLHPVKLLFGRIIHDRPEHDAMDTRRYSPEIRKRRDSDKAGGLASRNPILLLRFDGSFLLRLAERTL